MGDAVASVSGGERPAPIQIDFALIGHQERWRAAADVIAVLRGPEHTPLADDEIKDILPWIPPRAVCHVELGSTRGALARGLYIDSFIPPDRLEGAYTHDNLARVRAAAAACAIQAGAKMVSLGGFSSILMEGNFDQLPERHDTVFTTGNTLTVGFIVQGIQKMCALEGRNIGGSTLLIVGATGDVGSGCARCLAPLVKRVLLSAQRGSAMQASRRVESRWSASGDGDRSRAILRRGRSGDLRGQPCVPVPSIGPHRAPCNRLRCGLPELPRNSQSASVPRCGPWMSARRHGSGFGAPV